MARDNDNFIGPHDGSVTLPWSQQGWMAQVLRHYLSKYFPSVNLMNDDLINRATIGIYGVWMIIYSFANFARNLRAGVLLISPPLILMSLAGFVAIGLSRPMPTSRVAENPEKNEGRAI